MDRVHRLQIPNSQWKSSSFVGRHSLLRYCGAGSRSCPAAEHVRAIPRWRPGRVSAAPPCAGGSTHVRRAPKVQAELLGSRHKPLQKPAGGQELPPLPRVPRKLPPSTPAVGRLDRRARSSSRTSDRIHGTALLFCPRGTHRGIACATPGCCAGLKGVATRRSLRPDYRAAKAWSRREKALAHTSAHAHQKQNPARAPVGQRQVGRRRPPTAGRAARYRGGPSPPAGS